MLGIALAIAVSQVGISATAEHPPTAQTCLRTLQAEHQDSIPQSSAFEPVRCDGSRVMAAFRYDRSLGATKIARDLAVGEVVETYPEYGGRIVLPGQVLTLVVDRGIVRVERDVTALQEARPGQNLFVRSADGEILSVRFEDDAR